MLRDNFDYTLIYLQASLVSSWRQIEYGALVTWDYTVRRAKEELAN